MDYQFENLGPERFQEFCQALLVKTVPGVQCFPIGQADGGRDAIGSLGMHSKGSFAVYQVKFVRNPNNLKAPHQWLRDVLLEEAPKLKRLIPKGAAEYYLLTNVRGTAVPEVGSIDAVESILREHLEVKAQCWWRDDLNRRLEAAADLKWSFPELFTGADLLRVLIEQGLQGDQQRRSNAIVMFVRTQHDREQEVRFKQVELQNKLIDLFIDVPVGAPQPLEEPTGMLTWKRVLQRHRLDDRNETVGAATFLLSSLIEPCFSQLVLEGAPGQGKSTITQYVCQVHRMRLLGEANELAAVIDTHKNGALRLPIRADLRDYATWLGKQDPFAVEPDASAPQDWHRSLDAFLAALIRHEAGGIEFSVADLHETIRISAVLIVLDGLDEIADVHKRHLVIGEVQAASSRLREIAASLQIIVTSRPAAFANSPGFAAATFPHVQLAALTRPLIDAYADRWLAARRLSGREAVETKGILSVKLKQPHLLALAKNPMQLAILLSLIHTRGASLPDKRTALYDSYVDLFFSREAEKSAVVRDQRDLLTDIHGYLGWVLHTAAEKGSHSGSISNSQLKEFLREYLRNESRDPLLVDTLFSGMVERVVFLVSRVEGTVEFEVQPLREYFAARYLYETAPYSPPGAERKGTKPDRFDGMARNFYWLNVTRFFAGCFSKGELPALVDRIQELEQSDVYKLTGHPRRLAAMLLADWVFNQHQRSTHEAIKLVTDGIARGDIVSVNQRLRRQQYIGVDDTIVLPEGCGRTEIVRACTDLLGENLPIDFVAELVETIRANATEGEIDSWWRTGLPRRTGRELTQWLTYGLRSGALGRCRSAGLRIAQQHELAKPENLDLLVESGQEQYVMDSQSLTQSWFAGWRTGITAARRWRTGSGLLTQFLSLTDPSRFSVAFDMPAPRPLAEVVEHRFGPLTITVERERVYKGEELRRCKEMVEMAASLWSRDASDWARNLDLWNTLVEKLRSSFGESVSALELSLLAAKAKDVTGVDETHGELLDTRAPLCHRIRHARLRAGAARWWSTQLAAAASSFEKLTVTAALVKWAGDATALRLCEGLSPVLDSLDDDTWRVLVRITSAYWMPPTRPKRQLNAADIPATCSPRFVVIMEHRLTEQNEANLYLRMLREYDGTDQHVLEFCVRNAVTAALRNDMSWNEALNIAERAYKHGVVGDGVLRRHFPNAPQRFPLPSAQRIMRAPRDYSRALVYQAAERCRLDAANRVSPLVDVATKQQWFIEESATR